MSVIPTFLKHLKCCDDRDKTQCVEYYYNEHGLRAVLRQEYEFEGKVLNRYYAKYSVEELQFFISATPEPERCFHEVMVSKCRRVYLDIDLKLEPTDNYEWIESIMPRVYDVIKSSASMMYWGKLCSDHVVPDWMIFTSTDKTKVSLHIIARNVATQNLKDAAAAAQQALVAFSTASWQYSSEDPDDRFSDFCDKLWRAADLGVYGELRCLRTLHSHKPGSSRVKRAVGDIQLSDSFVTHFNKSRVTMLGEKPETQSNPFGRVLEAYATADLDEDIQLVLDYKFADTKIGSYYQFASREGNSMKFTRLFPGPCPCCNRSHESVGGFAYRTADRTLMFRCFRAHVYGAKAVVIVDGDCETEFTPAGPRKPWSEWREHEHALAAENTVIQNQKHVTIDWNPRTVVVKSGLGTGKTKALAEFVKTVGTDTQIIIVTPRRSLGREFTRVFPDFEHYEEINGGHGQIDSTHKRVIVQFESLHRIVNPSKFVLVLDEIVAIRGQAKFNHKHRGHSLSALDYLARHAEKLIALDGGLTTMELDWIKHTRGNDLQLTINEYKTAAGKIAAVYPDKPTWRKKVYDLIGNSAAEPVVVACGSKTEADEIYHDAVAAIGADRVCLHTAATISENENLADTGTRWSKCDVLIYSPTITVGVSYEEKHFHHLCAFFTYASVTAATAHQMTKRVRQFENATAHIYVGNEGKVRHLPKTRAAVKRAIERVSTSAHFKGKMTEEGRELIHGVGDILPARYSPDGKMFSVPDGDPVVNAYIDAVIVQNQSRMKFKSILATKFHNDGYRFVNVEPLVSDELVAVKQTIEDTKLTVAIEAAESISQARIIGEGEYLALSDGNAKSFEDQLAIERFKFKKFYGAADSEVDKFTVNKWWKPHIVSVMRQIKLFSITAAPAVGEVTDWEQVVENIGSRISHLQQSVVAADASTLIDAHERMRVNERALVGISIMKKVFGPRFTLVAPNTCTKENFYTRINEYTLEHGLDKPSGVADLNERLGLTNLTAQIFVRGKVTEQKFALSTFKYYRTLLEKTIGINLDIGKVTGKRVKDAAGMVPITTDCHELSIKQSHNGTQLVYHPVFVNIVAAPEPVYDEFTKELIELTETL